MVNLRTLFIHKVEELSARASGKYRYFQVSERRLCIDVLDQIQKTFLVTLILTNYTSHVTI